MPRSWLRTVALLLLAAFFVLAGAMHFARSESFVAIVPHWLPAPRALVYVSGVAEILGGLGVLWPSLRSLAGWWLVALLIAVYPANIYMALHYDEFLDVAPSIWFHVIRLPLQFVLIGLAWWFTRQ